MEITDNKYFIKRLTEFVESKKMSVNKFELSCGLTKGVIGGAKFNSGSLGTDKMIKILIQYPELNANWLLTGTGDMILNVVKMGNNVVLDNHGDLSQNQNVFPENRRDYQTIRECEEKIRGQDKEIQRLEELLSLKDEIIQMLKSK